jgi:preprotein translocase subunit YajC
MKQAEGVLLSLLPFFLIFLVFYFLIILPQKRQKERRKQMLQNLQRGDAVVTTGGICAKVVAVKGDEVILEVAPSINLVFLKDAILYVREKRK